jgi:hypothetical protein
MDFIYRSTPPGYKGKAKQLRQGGAGFLSGLWCYLFGGGAAPGYRAKDETNGATSPVVPRCWWGLTAAPQYRTPPAAPSDPEPEVPPCGEPTAEDCSCEPDAGVVPREIHIYPGG